MRPPTPCAGPRGGGAPRPPYLPAPEGAARGRRLAARVQHWLFVGAVVKLADDARVERGRPRHAAPRALHTAAVHAHGAAGRPESII